MVYSFNSHLTITFQSLIIWFIMFMSQAQHERHENSILKSENEKLRVENTRYREALASATCPNCGGPAAIGEMSFDEQQLRIENARLREEVWDETARLMPSVSELDASKPIIDDR